MQIILEVPSYLICSLSAYTPFRFRPDFLEPDNPVVAELNETDEMVSHCRQGRRGLLAQGSQRVMMLPQSHHKG